MCIDRKKDMKDFYKSARWKRIRSKVLRRDEYICQECKKYGRIKEATQVHHIEHLEDRPDLAYDLDNLISLCLGCHNKEHPEKGGSRGKCYG